MLSKHLLGEEEKQYIIEHALDGIQENQGHYLFKPGIEYYYRAKNKEPQYLDPKDEILLSETELNAFSMQIANTLKPFIKTKDDKKKLKDWMRTQDVFNIPEPITGFAGLLLLWKDYKPEFFRRFFLRLYNSLIVDIPDTDNT